MRLNTEYTVGEIPHSEHPMPQCMRKNWRCLNGKWELKKVIILDSSQEEELNGITYLLLLVMLVVECVHYMNH